MKAALISFLFLIINIACTARQTDSIEIIGQFTGDVANLPGRLQLTQYQLPNPVVDYLQVNPYGSFTYKVLLTEPHLFTILLPNASYSFIAGPDEKTFRIMVALKAGEVEKVNTEGSKENEAYSSFTKTADPFIEQLYGYLSAPAAQNNMVNNTNAHLLNMRQIARAYKGTYTADVLARSLLFDSVVTEVSPAYFKDHLLKVNAMNNPAYYNTSYSADILSVYTRSFIDTSRTDAFNFYDVLFENVTAPGANSRLSELLFQLYFYKHRETQLGIYADWVNSHPGKVTNGFVQRQLAGLSKIMAGKKAPELVETNMQGNKVSLTTTAQANKKTLLVIWSPNCEHCREEVPQLKGLYDKYHAAGFQIFAVAIDCTEEEWRNFSNQQNFSWINTYHPTLQNNDPLNDYMVSYTPTYVILDGNSNIISRFARFRQIEGFIR